MNSKIKFYSVGFTPEKNALVDDFPNYIENFAIGGPEMDIQFIKDFDLDLSITVYDSQSNLKKFSWNYAKIVQNGVDYYFFVMGTNWRAQETLELTLSMDTLNTFYWTIQEGFVEGKTLVMRQHADRFYKPNLVNGHVSSTLDTLYGAINDTDEGLGGISKFNSKDDNYVVGPSEKWYLIYASLNKSVDVSKSFPIQCFLCSETEKTFTNPYAGEVEIFSDDLFPDDEDPYVYALTSEENNGNSFVAGGVTYTVDETFSYLFYHFEDKIRLLKILNRDSSFRSIGDFPSLTFNDVDYVVLAQKSYGMPTKYTNTGDWFKVISNCKGSFDIGAGVNTALIDSIKSVDRTLSNILKIIELPYAPTTMAIYGAGFSLPNGWKIATTPLGIDHRIKLLQLENLNTEFGQVIAHEITVFNDYALPAESERGSSIDLGYEPKMFNSQFHTEKFLYDSFSKEIKLENQFNYDYRTGSFRKVDIYFKPSNSINSNMLFDFRLTSNRSDEDYDNIMICRRNNELPLYNSDYLNYLRTGYNFDVKNKADANTQRWINTSFGLASSAVGGFSGFKTKGLGAVAGAALLGNAITSLTNTIYAQQQADRELEQKLAELRAQAGSVQGADDLDLLNYYNGNKLIRASYDVSDENYNNIRELFRKTGYAVNAYFPVDMDSRRSYNFVQCDPVFVEHGGDVWKEFEDDVIARFQIGVTVYHPFKIYKDQDFMYDFDQYYENWETWICPRDLVF